MVGLSRRRFLGAAGVALLAGCGREPLPGPPPADDVLARVIEAERRAAAAVAGVAPAIARQDRAQLAALGARPPAAAGDAAAALERKQEAVFTYVDAATKLEDPAQRVLMMEAAAAEAGHIAALRMAAGAEPVPDAFAGYTSAFPGDTAGAAAPVAAPDGGDDAAALRARLQRRFHRGDSDADLIAQARIVEELSALAYDAAPLRGALRKQAIRFARHESEHARALASMQLALTVPVVRHAVPADLDAVLPELAGGRPGAALRALADLESAAIAGHVALGRDLGQRELLRTVATVMAGAGQHLVVLRAALGEDPVTRAFETGS